MITELMNSGLPIDPPRLTQQINAQNIRMKSAAADIRMRIFPVDLILYTAAAALSLLIILRAFYVDFTHDEAVSFFSLVLNESSDVFVTADANNHLLNTLLMRVTYKIAGVQEFAFRLPNIIAGLMYVWLSLRLVKEIFSHRLSALAAFTLINSQILVVEFFSLARGYGLALGFIMLTVYCVYRLINSHSPLFNMVIASAAACGASFANFTAINFTLSALLAVWVIFVAVTQWKRSSPLSRLINGSALLIIIASAVWVVSKFISILFELRKNAALYYGSDGFETSLKSVFYGSFVEIDHRINNSSDGLAYMMSAIITCLFVISLYTVVRHKRSNITLFAAFVGFTLISCLSGLVLQHNLFNTLYPNLRTGVYLTPLIGLTIIACVALIEKFYKIIARTFICIVALPALLSFAWFINLTRTFSWSETEGTFDAVTAMITDAHKFDVIPGTLSVSCSNELRPSVNYYLFKLNDSLFNFIRAHEYGFRKHCNYYFTSVSDTTISKKFPSVYHGGALNLNRVDKTMSRRFVAAGYADFESEGNEKRLEVRNNGHVIMLDTSWTDSRLINDTLELLNDQEVIYLIEANVKPTFTEQNSVFVFSVQRDGICMFWKDYPIYFTPGSEGKWQIKRCTVIMPETIQSGDIISVYLKNPDVAPLFADDMKLSRSLE